MANAYRAQAQKTTGKEGSPAPQKRSPWILGAWRDLAFFVATPALILPAFLLAQSAGLSIEDLALAVLAFGALGHHLPGMMRAYGDRELFKQYRVRFILAPLFLIAVCTAFTLWQLSALILAVYLWGAWHGLAQIYGFVRIYDAKVGSFLKRTKKLDFAMCVAWMGTGIIWSPTRLYFLLDLYHVQCGGPLPSAGFIFGIQATAAAITLIITALFFLNHLALWRRGMSPSWIKIVLLATAFAFWWYANFSFSNMIVGVALFEVFHDVQYLAIVWYFNRNRAEKDPACGSFTRFLFRRYKWLISLVIVAVYVGLVFAYGSLRYLEQAIPQNVIRDGLTGILAASGLLHFYYDGFIWKVRDKKTSQALGVTGVQDAEAKKGLSVPPWLIHGGKWSLFLIPLILLATVEPKARGNEFKRLSGLVALVPENEQVHKQLADVYMENGETEKAISHYEKAIEHGLKLPGAHHRLGELYTQLGDRDRARSEYERSVAMNARASHSVVNIGLLLATEGKYDEAIEQYNRALEIDPKQAGAHANLGHALYNQRKFDEARPWLETAVDLDPALVMPHNVLGSIAAIQGRHQDAILSYRSALIVDPGSVPTLVQLGRSLVATGETSLAEQRFRDALEKSPRSPGANFNLAVLLEKRGDDAEALVHYEQALLSNPRLEPAREAIERLGGSLNAPAGSSSAANPEG